MKMKIIRLRFSRMMLAAIIIIAAYPNGVWAAVHCANPPAGGGC